MSMKIQIVVQKFYLQFSYFDNFCQFSWKNIFLNVSCPQIRFLNV